MPVEIASAHVPDMDQLVNGYMVYHKALALRHMLVHVLCPLSPLNHSWHGCWPWEDEHHICIAGNRLQAVDNSDPGTAHR